MSRNGPGYRKIREDDYETAVKVVIVGNGGVGKSSLIQRFCTGIFTNEYKKTIGVDFLEKIVRVGANELRLMLWDTAGQEEFDALTKAYYRGSHACLLVFSTTDRDSFDAIATWKKKVEYECGQITMVLVQNKIDLASESVINRDELEQKVRSLNLKLFRTSVKEKINIEEVFDYIAESYVESMDDLQDEAVSPAGLKSALVNVPTPVSNPLFSFTGPPSKYRWLKSKSSNYFGSSNNSVPSNVFPVLHQYKYKNRFQLIPIRHSSTISLHHHHRHHSHHHHHHHHRHRSDKFFKNPLFKNCFIL